jgi:3-keto-5-aminohexanoate cleavage enzyme
MVHLHARDNNGVPSSDKALYAEIIAGIRQFAPELIICVSTSGRLVSSLEARSDVLSLTGELKPDMASLTLSSLNFNKQASINAPDMVQGLAQNHAGARHQTGTGSL